MPPKPDLTVRIEDVHGDLIAESADLLLTDTRTGARRRLTVGKGKSLRLSGLSHGPMVVYQAEVDPASYLRVVHFLAVSSGANETTRFVIPADPTKVAPVFSAYAQLSADCCAVFERSNDVLGQVGKSRDALFSGLDPIQRAGLLNVLCKSEHTPLPNSRSVLAYLREVYEVRGDRSFFIVDKELRELVKSAATAGFFKEASDKLHHPHQGYTRAGSWKTTDRYGNLQLTFWAGEQDWRADIDIDDAAGLEHLFQVARNHLTGLPTHPYAIHQILVRHQRINPAYRLAPL